MREGMEGGVPNQKLEPMIHKLPVIGGCNNDTKIQVKFEFGVRR